MAAIAARTKRIEIGTGVIDMRYENPLYMAEQAAATDLISDGRLQIGVSRGSPEPAANGAADFGYYPLENETVADMARRHTASFRHAISGAGVAEPGGHASMGGERLLRIEPQAPGLAQRIWWGAGSRDTAVWAARQGMNLMSSTLLTEDTGVPFDELQAEQIQLFRDEWIRAGHNFVPRVSVSRSVIPVVDDIDRMYFGLRAQSENKDQVGMIDGFLSRFGKSYMGDPADIASELAADAAVQGADTLMLTVPNQLGVAYNTKMLATIAEHIAPAIGWKPATA